MVWWTFVLCSLLLFSWLCRREGPTWQSLLKDDLPLLNAGLCCPLGVEGKIGILKSLLPNGGKTLCYENHVFFITIYKEVVSNIDLFSFRHSDGLFWLCSESCCVGLVSSQPGVWCVRGRSNPISAPDPGSQDLLCLYQTCFVLCLLNPNLFAYCNSKSKQSCLQVVQEKTKAKSPQACYTPLFTIQFVFSSTPSWTTVFISLLRKIFKHYTCIATKVNMQ